MQFDINIFHVYFNTYFQLFKRLKITTSAYNMKKVFKIFSFFLLSYFEYRHILPNKMMDLSPFEHHRKIEKKEKKEKRKSGSKT
jgi:hypothetical protein